MSAGDQSVRSLAAVPAEAAAAAGPHRSSSATIEVLRREFEELGLSPYEARVLLALIRFGSASPGQLARSAEVHRTSTYKVLQELSAKGLADRVPGSEPAIWSSPGRAEALKRLEAAQEARLQQHRARSQRVRDLLDESFPESPEVFLPYVQLIHEMTRIKPLYERMLSDATSEVLVFNRPPYSWSLGSANPIVLDAAQRVQVRVLYQSPQVNDPAGDLWRKEMEAYHAAGVEGRVVEDLPSKLAVVDRRVALLSLDDPVLPHIGHPTHLLVEHPGFATMQAGAFDNLWALSESYDAARKRAAPG